MARRLLRVKTGCERCRKRRKKCDELKPICGACRRWNFACVWNHPTGDSKRAERALVKSPALANVAVPSSLTGHGCRAFRDQAQLSLLRDFGTVYQCLICPLAVNEYVDLSEFVAISLNETWTRDALNAFTGYMMFARTANKRMKEAALSSYQMAVSGLKQRLSHELHPQGLLSMLMAATFLGLFEALGTGNAHLTVAHFALVARLGPKCLAQHDSDPSILPLYRILFEDVIYNLATKSVFIPVPETVLGALHWADYGRIYSRSLDNLVPEYQLSPHFGGNHEFYHLVLAVACFSRQDHSAEVRARQTRIWFAEIDGLERRLDTYYDGAPQDAAATYKAKYQLHAIALRIYCLKIQDHSIRPCDPHVVDEVQRAKNIVYHSPLQENNNPAVFWPLVVLLCACSDHASFLFLSQQIERMKLNFDPGHWRQLEDVLNELGTTFSQEVDIGEGQTRDNLGLLLRKGGMAAACF